MNTHSIPPHAVKRALISVYDKTGIVEFARALVEEFGIEIISTGGTAQVLKEHEIEVTLVEQVTGFPETMEGRVKTLHPKIHAAVLADRDNPKHMQQLQAQGIEPIDLVVVNLYPFERTVADPHCAFEQAVEMIDIGGPCLLRAAAKNHKHVLVATDVRGQQLCLAYLRGQVAGDEARLRQELAALAFNRTEEYDGTICSYLTDAALKLEETPEPEAGKLPIFEEQGHSLIQVWDASQPLRYGENPHQQAAYLVESGTGNVNVGPAQVVAGKDLSFNNYADANAALALCKDLTRARASRGLQPARTGEVRGAIQGEDPTSPLAACLFVKHTNACGVGRAREPVEAYRRAYLGDPNAAMGGVLACNFDISAEFATAVMETYSRWGKEAGAGAFFIEVWVGPSFDEQALGVIREGKKWGERVRLLAVGDMSADPEPGELDYRKIGGGMLVQTPDLVGLDEDQWQVVTERQPTAAELADLRLALLICKHTKSNAITICKDGMLLGNGAGQTSRVMSCRLAAWLARDNGHAEQLAAAAAASDAFFPFRDGPDVLADAGVTALIQPGGSKRDAETVAACNERNLAMIFTGTRHFKH